MRMKKNQKKKTKMRERKTEEIKILFLFAREICACLPYGLSARMLHGFRRDLLRAPTHPLSRPLAHCLSTPRWQRQLQRGNNSRSRNLDAASSVGHNNCLAIAWQGEGGGPWHGACLFILLLLLLFSVSVSYARGSLFSALLLLLKVKPEPRRQLRGQLQRP